MKKKSSSKICNKTLNNFCKDSKKFINKTKCTTTNEDIVKCFCFLNLKV